LYRHWRRLNVENDGKAAGPRAHGAGWPVVYPRFYDGVRAAKYCVPIQGLYHEKLFPEISFRPQPPLFAAGGIARERTARPHQERTPGNTIRKVYLCRAQAKGLKPGDIIERTPS